MSKMALKDVPVGKTFEVWGRKFTVLKQEQDATFVLAAEFATTMPFRNDGAEYATAPNDFRDSSVKAYLNGEYIDELVEAGADRNEDILPLEIDLKCTPGQHEYGTDVVKAGLLTLEQYGEYHDIIPSVGSSWWLATPWKTPSHPPYNFNASDVWTIYNNGGYNYSSYNNSYGIRPALNLNPSLLVYWADDRITEYVTRDINILSSLTLDELLDEIKRRFPKE